MGVGINWEYTDWVSIAWQVPTNSSFGGAGGPVQAAPVIIYGVTPDGQPNAGNLVWYLHLGAADGTDRWKTGPEPIATGWEFTNAFSGGKGILYGVDQKATLHWFRHPGAQQGTPGLIPTSDPKGYIGEGWRFKQVFSGGDGILYAVDNAGHLLWYRHLGFADGSDKWLTTKDPKGYIGEGWDMQHVFSGGNGIIYAVTHGGLLLWYRHLGYADGTDRWETTPDKKGHIGEGWNMRHVFSSGNGIIYAVTQEGLLLWYRHLGYADGTDHWETTPDKKGHIGEGWNFKFVFAGEGSPQKIG